MRAAGTLSRHRIYSKPDAASSVRDHSPDGVTWISRSKWKLWDGNVIKVKGLSPKEIQRRICPSGDTIVGLRELFYKHNPFADVCNLTKAEVDEWHRLCIVHLRELVGITTPIEKDHCLFARALWAQERRWSDKWDAAYPDGTCLGSKNGHCGATFLTRAADQTPYLPSGYSSCGRPAGSEGVSSAPKSSIPWGIKWVRVFCNVLGTDGLSAHTGPFFGRTKFGWSFWDANYNDENSNAVFRGKWGGAIVEPNFS